MIKSVIVSGLSHGHRLHNFIIVQNFMHGLGIPEDFPDKLRSILAQDAQLLEDVQKFTVCYVCLASPL